MPQHQTQVSTQDLIQEISRVSERNIHEVITIKAVYVRNASGVWEYLLGKCEVGRDEVPDEKIYSDYAFVSKSIKNVSWEILFKNLSSEGYEVSENLPAIKNSGSPNISWTRHLIPSHATTHGYPAKKYTATINNGVYFTDGPLIKYGLPFFESSQAYIKNFLGSDSFFGSSDGRKGEFSIEVPDYSARIKYENESIFIDSKESDICIVGSSPYNDSIIISVQDRVQLKLSDLVSSELWLVNKNDEIIDFRSRSHWQYKINDVDYTLPKKLLTLIDGGESETVEFKSYIEVTTSKNSKAEDIEKAVCAFSNANGGILFLALATMGI